MKITVSKHTDGTYLIKYVAETPDDRIANQLLLYRYDTVPVIGGESFIGGWDSDGRSLTLKVFQFSREELMKQQHADAMIAALTEDNHAPFEIEIPTPILLAIVDTSRAISVRNFNELLRSSNEIIETVPGEHHFAPGDAFTCHREGFPSETLRVVVTNIELPRAGTTRIIFKRCPTEP